MAGHLVHDWPTLAPFAPLALLLPRFRCRALRSSPEVPKLPAPEFLSPVPLCSCAPVLLGPGIGLFLRSCSPARLAVSPAGDACRVAGVVVLLGRRSWPRSRRPMRRVPPLAASLRDTGFTATATPRPSRHRTSLCRSSRCRPIGPSVATRSTCRRARGVDASNPDSWEFPVGTKAGRNFASTVRRPRPG